MDSSGKEHDESATDLSDAQIAQFKRDGFLVVRALYAPGEVAEISAWTDEVAHYPEVPGKYMMYFEKSRSDGSRIICRIENFVPYHPGFSKLITARRMQQAVSELFGEEAVLFKDKINFKQPGGGGFDPHQDVQAGWPFATCITAMIAIGDQRGQRQPGMIAACTRRACSARCGRR
jgi:hypothetical protein